MNLIIHKPLADVYERLSRQDAAAWFSRSHVTFAGDPHETRPLPFVIARQWKERGGGWFNMAELHGTLTPQQQHKTLVEGKMSLTLRGYLIVGLLVMVGIVSPDESRWFLTPACIVFAGFTLYDAFRVREVLLD